MRKWIVHLLAWVDYALTGPEPIRACEYRRPARITCHRHGQRRRRDAASAV